MGNTLKLGNGKWATGKDTVLAFNDLNNNFKPLPFSFSRASSATVVNQQGLIETVASGVPRIDFTDANGALLLESQRTNTITYSNDFSNGWAYFDSSTVANELISPSGALDASKFIEGSGSSIKRIINLSQSIVSGNNYTFSIFAKKGERDFITLTNSTGAIDVTTTFDLTNGTVTSGSGSIESLTNGWFRCSRSFTAAATVTSNYIAQAFINNGSGISYTGDGTSGIYIYGAQIEQGSYATSYIPTQGSAVTVVADVCSQTPPSGIIGQTEGTVYAEVKINGLKNSNTIVTLHNGSFSEYLVIAGNLSGNINAYIFAGGVQQAGIFAGIYAVDSFVKCAMAYKQNDVAFYINGVLIGTDSSATMASTSIFDVGSISFGNYTLQGSVKQAQLYNTRLSNAELIALTTI